MDLLKNRKILKFLLGPFILLIISIPLILGFSHHHLFKLDPKIEILNKYELPSELVETSGLLYYNHLVWSFNDSGGEPELYAWSEKKNKIEKRVTLWNAYNFDWEDIAQDSSYIYVGDIGNNFGNRGNLCIYRIQKKGLKNKGNDLVKAKKITFTYPGYKPHSIFHFIKSSFDCEAMVCKGDSIYLFTKDWNTHHTTVYSLSKEPGDYIAHQICCFNSKGLITAADYDGKRLFLLGYKDYKVFLWIFKHIADFDLTKHKGIRLDLTGLGSAQAEGIAIKDSETIYISSEKCSINQCIWKIKLTEI